MIKLENKNRRTFMILGTIFHQNGRFCTANHITSKNVVGGQLIIPVGRNPYLALIDEAHNVLQRIAHASIIEEAKQCVNELAVTATTHKGGG